MSDKFEEEIFVNEFQYCCGFGEIRLNDLFDNIYYRRPSTRKRIIIRLFSQLFKTRPYAGYILTDALEYVGPQKQELFDLLKKIGHCHVCGVNGNTGNTIVIFVVTRKKFNRYINALSGKSAEQTSVS